VKEWVDVRKGKLKEKLKSDNTTLALRTKLPEREVSGE
jgi:hypothetical protein